MNKGFHYTYTAPTEEERKEIESIKRQYVETEKREEKRLTFFFPLNYEFYIFSITALYPPSP